MNKLVNNNSFIISGVGLAIGFLNVLLIRLIPLYLFIYLGLLVAVIFILQRNIVNIYGRLNDKYATIDGYNKRLYATVGLGLVTVYTLLMMLVYLIAMLNLIVGLIVLIVIIVTPFESWLINNLWLNYDQKIYREPTNDE